MLLAMTTLLLVIGELPIARSLADKKQVLIEEKSADAP